jgi:hypothetical protein
MYTALGAFITAIVTGSVSIVLTVLNRRQTKLLQEQKAATDRQLSELKATTDGELQRQRARLDLLDRLHSRRVEQIEKLYAAFEAAVEALPQQQLDPNEYEIDFKTLHHARDCHGRARIYLPDSVDRLCLDFIEELNRGWDSLDLGSNFPFGGESEELQRALREIKVASRHARELRNEIRVALRELLSSPEPW